MVAVGCSASAGSAGVSDAAFTWTHRAVHFRLLSLQPVVRLPKPLVDHWRRRRRASRFVLIRFERLAGAYRIHHLVFHRVT